MEDLTKSLNEIFNNFNPETDSISQVNEKIPAGNYYVRFDGAKPANSQSSSWVGISLTFEIIDGEFKGRKITDAFNLETFESNGKVYTFRAEENARKVSKLGFVLDIPSENKPKDIQDLGQIESYLNVGEGKFLDLDLSYSEYTSKATGKTGENKIFDFSKHQSQGNGVINDDNLPF